MKGVLLVVCSLLVIIVNGGNYTRRKFIARQNTTSAGKRSSTSSQVTDHLAFAQSLYNNVNIKKEKTEQWAYVMFQPPDSNVPVFQNEEVRSFMDNVQDVKLDLKTYNVWPANNPQSNFAVAGLFEHKDKKTYSYNFYRNVYNERHAEHKIIYTSMIDMDDYYYEKTEGGCPAFVMLSSKREPCSSESPQPVGGYCADEWVMEKTKYIDETHCDDTQFYVYVKVPNEKNPYKYTRFWTASKQRYRDNDITILCDPRYQQDCANF